MAGPQEKLQGAVTAAMDRLDRSYIRKLSKKAYLCMANCHDQGSFDSQALQQCVGGCSVALQEVNQMIGNELSYFQGRLQRCSAACEDHVRDTQQRAGGGKPDAKQQAALQKQYDACVGKCADTHIGLVKAMEEKLATECKKRL